VINARFLRPLDMTTILTSVRKTKRIVTIEDNVLVGGFGSSILSLLSINQEWNVKALCLGWPDHFIQHGDTEELFQLYGLDADSVTERVRDFIEGKA
jgi:1-deoxy-D-xylulose-5-phosphate synthase